MIDPLLENIIKERGNKRRIWFYGLLVNIKAFFKRKI